MNLTFIKLDINIIDDDKIFLITSRADGDTLFRLWVSIICLAMKSGRPGTLEIGDGIPYTPDQLAKKVRMELGQLERGLQLFKELRMIDVLEDGHICLTNFEKHQELGQINRVALLNRDRQQRYRDNQKALSAAKTYDNSSRNVTVTSPDNVIVTDQIKTKTETKKKTETKNKTEEGKDRAPEGKDKFLTFGLKEVWFLWGTMRQIKGMSTAFHPSGYDQESLREIAKMSNCDIEIIGKKIDLYLNLTTDKFVSSKGWGLRWLVQKWDEIGNTPEKEPWEI